MQWWGWSHSYGLGDGFYNVSVVQYDDEHKPGYIVDLMEDTNFIFRHFLYVMNICYKMSVLIQLRIVTSEFLTLFLNGFCVDGTLKPANNWFTWLLLHGFDFSFSVSLIICPFVLITGSIIGFHTNIKMLRCSLPWMHLIGQCDCTI